MSELSDIRAAYALSTLWRKCETRAGGMLICDVCGHSLFIADKIFEDASSPLAGLAGQLSFARLHGWKIVAPLVPSNESSAEWFGRKLVFCGGECVTAYDAICRLGED